MQLIALGHVDMFIIGRKSDLGIGAEPAEGFWMRGDEHHEDGGLTTAKS